MSKLFNYFTIDLKQINELNKEKPKKNKRKSVSINGVEIIDVQSYKSFNNSKETAFESFENSFMNNGKSCNCMIF